MITFKKLRLRNFKNIGGAWVEIEFDKTGFYRIQGANGTGKSTILSALCFLYYGKNSDMRNDSKTPISTSELINDLNKKELEAELYLDNGMVIRRGLKPDYFEILDSDGVNLANKSSKVIDQSFLEQELLDGMSFQMFHKLTYVSSKAISTPFLYMTPSQRKEFMEHILDIRLIYYVGEEIKKRISTKKLELSTANTIRDSTVMSIKNEKQNLENLEAQVKEQTENSQKILEERQTLIDEYTAKIVMCNANINLLETELQTYQSNYNKIVEQEKLISDFISSLKVYETEQQSTHQKMLTIQQQAFKLKTERDVFYSNVSKFPNCNGCDKLQHITGTFDEETYNRSMEDFRLSIEECNGIMQKCSAALSKLPEAQKKFDEVKIWKDKMLTEISLRNSSLSTNNVEISHLEKMIESIKSSMEDVKPIEISYAYYDSLCEKLNQSDTQVDSITKAIEQLERIKKRVGDKTLHKQVMEQYVPIFQSKVNELLAKFMEDDPFSFTVEIDELFNISGKKNGKDSNLFKLSEGQKTSIHFAIMFAIQYIMGLKNASNSNVLLIDEILDLSLDADRVTKVVEYLKDLSNDKLVVLISHNNDISSEYFDKIITVTKQFNFSSYEIV